ncbi:MAG: DUF1801 domain-containing protein [Saprospiraceae bacterium]|nr:DUF1801 domain-containing protein [Saprospiraceae bacterium]
MKDESNAVEIYITNAPPDRQEALKKLRSICRDILVDHQESIAYNMPSYIRNDQVEVAFASQKNQICIYILKHDVMLANTDLLKDIDHGKGSIRYSNPDKIDYAIIEKILKETMESDNTIC